MEMFPIVNENGDVIGSASRTECHGGSMKLHPVVHLHIFNDANQIYLQKRSMKKDIQPGKWDTAVGGHMDLGETPSVAVCREAREELGITGLTPIFILRYLFQSDVERELVNSFYVKVGNDFNPTPDGDEVDAGRFWSFDEIRSNMGKGIFTPNFEMEFERLFSGADKRVII